PLKRNHLTQRSLPPWFVSGPLCAIVTVGIGNTAMLVAQCHGKIALIPWQNRPNGFGRSKIMTSTKQIEANRRNSLKSTGPKTPEGKAVASLNNLRHGLRARTVVLPGEKSEEFHRLCDDL